MTLVPNPHPSPRSRLLHHGFVALLIASSLLSPAALSAAPPDSPQQAVHDARIPALLAELGKVRSIRQTSISPDGKFLAWVLSIGHGSTEIYVAPVANPSASHKLSAANKPGCEEGSVAWSPDSKTLAFLSDCAVSGQPDIYLSEATDTQTLPRRLTNLKGFVQSLQWAPNGKSIGFLYVAGATRPSGALAAMKPPSGVIGEDGLEIQRVAVADAVTGQVRELTPEALHVYEFDWSPNSAKLAYIAAPPPGENNWWVAQLYTQPVSNPKDEGNATTVLDPDHVDGPLHGLQIAVPRWSPDGKFIAVIGGLMSDQGSTGGDIYLVPSTGGKARNLTPGVRFSPSWIQWEDPGSIAFTAIAGGSATLRFVGTAGDAPLTMDAQVSVSEPAFTLPGQIGDGRQELSLSGYKGADHVAFIRSSYSMPPEVWFWNPLDNAKPFTQVTHMNDSLKPTWGETESVSWKSDGFDVQGWLLYPANFDPSKKYPLVVFVHGGPASAVLPRWPGAGFGPAPFSAMGYFVLEANPRGSYGQGEAFTQANKKDFGYGDLRDILAGVDTVAGKLPIDQQRIGLTGWSYGGFMSMFAVTQTNRFRAAVAGAGISNWQSYYGENSIDQWMIPYFGASVYDDPGVYARSSALTFVHKIKTPTLIVVGDRDGECPAPQSFEFWHALKAQHVPTQLVVYPDEGHAFRSPQHRVDVLERALEWFQKYMPPQPPS